MGITSGKKKWLRKTTAAGPKYAANIRYDDWATGVVAGSDGKLTREMVDISLPGKAFSTFAAKPDTEKAADYSKGVKGKEDKWERNWLRAFGG